MSTIKIDKHYFILHDKAQKVVGYSNDEHYVNLYLKDRECILSPEQFKYYRVMVYDHGDLPPQLIKYVEEYQQGYSCDNSHELVVIGHDQYASGEFAVSAEGETVICEHMSFLLSNIEETIFRLDTLRKFIKTTEREDEIFDKFIKDLKDNLHETIYNMDEDCDEVVLFDMYGVFSVLLKNGIIF